MLSSPLWNLPFLAALIAMMGYAYYSRHEHTQKLALAILGIYITSQVTIHTELMYGTYAAFDLVGIVYCNYLRFIDPKQKVTQLVLWAFVAMMLLHIYNFLFPMEWLKYQIAGNALFLAQLTMLCIYGKQYGIIARAEADEPRSDLYFRALVRCRLMT